MKASDGAKGEEEESIESGGGRLAMSDSSSAKS